MGDDFSQEPLLTPLVKRELEILRLLAEGCSNREIADKLFLTVETIKWYNKQIFSKMGVSSRTQAIARANELNLFDAPETASFAPVPSRPPNNLPIEHAPFIGRTRELQEVSALVADPTCRLVTLVGPGGIGKTRLGIKLAEHHVDSFEHGVFFVPLAGAESPESIVPAVADAVKLRFNQNTEPKDQLIRYLSQKHLLLVLDNFEQLLNGVSLVADMVAASPGVQVIATSRARLNLTAECVYPVDGLDVPATVEHVVFEDVEAVQMFAAYARRARPDFVLTDSDKGAVVEICKLVGGSPLGIELAAAWVRVLSPRDIAEELEASLDLLVTEMVDLPERQRSIRATFEYSWKMLTPDQQSGLQRLSVFRGGFTRESAKAVAGVSITALGGLVDHSLIKLGADGRYDIHELIRQFGEEKLAQGGEDAAIHVRHAEFMTALAEQAEQALRMGDQQTWLRRLDDEQDNIRAAMGWALGTCAVEAAMGIGAPLWSYFVLRGSERGYSRWLLQSLELDPGVPPALRAKTLRACSISLGTNHLVSQRDEINALREEALALYRLIGDHEGIIGMLYNITNDAAAHGDLARRRTLLEEALALAEQSGEEMWIAHVTGGLGWVTALEGRFEEAAPMVLVELEFWKRQNNLIQMRINLSDLGDIALWSGQYSQAHEYYIDALEIGRTLDDNIVWDLARLAMVYALEGDTERARCDLQASLSLAVRTPHDDDMRLPLISEILIWLGGAISRSEPVRGVRLLSAGKALYPEAMAPAFPPAWWALQDRLIAETRTRLTPESFEAAWAEGQAMSLEQAVAYALEEDVGGS